MAAVLKRASAALRDGDPLLICDVGANPLSGAPFYAPMLRDGLARVVGFEPQPEALAKLRAMASDAETYLPDAVGTGEDIDLHIFRSSGFTSKYPADAGTVALFHRYATLTEEKSVVRLPTLRLDDIAEVPPIDILKIDVQGSELDIIRNGRGKLSSAVAVQTEVRFFPIYEGEPDFGELHLELVAQGFRLHAFPQQKRVRFATGIPHERMPRRHLTQLIDGDAIYLRDLRGLADWPDRQVRLLGLFALHFFPAPDVAVLAMSELVKRGQFDRGLVDAYVDTLR
jgi:FkbM family methyltransferase